MPKKPTRKPEETRRASSPPRALTPAAIQTRLQRLDRQLLAMFQERARLTTKLASLAPVEGSCAEGMTLSEQLAQRLHASEGPLSERCLQGIFREVLSGCQSLIRTLKIAFLGPQYSYSHLAALQRFGRSVEFVPVATIAAVFEEVNRGHANYGLVPIENSTDGRVADTLDMFTRLPVRVCGEVEMCIHHTLLGKCSRNDVKEVYSRPQALSQCRNWLAKHLPHARTIEVTSTSTAAQLALEKPGAAAIASLQAGVHYGLDVLAERIEDNPSNTTRFALIGAHSAARTGKDKTVLLFQTEHRPGALAETLNIFKRGRLNLTWIESFPIPQSSRTYLFFVEFEGHETDARVRKAVALLQRRTLRLEILGSFPVTQTTD